MRSFDVKLGSRGSVTLAAGGSLVNGLLGAVMIAVSARQGMIADVAAFTVMTTLQAFVTGLSAGGSSILHMSGDDTTRRDVRRHRLLVVLPLMAVVGVAGSAFYAERGYAVVPMLAIAGVAMTNTLSELHYGDLRREFRFPASIYVALGSKSAALIMVLLGFRLYLALLIAAGLQIIMLEIAAGRHSWLRSGLRDIRNEPRRTIPLRPGLLAYSYLELYNSRIPVLALSLVTAPSLMGQFGVVYSSYLAMAAVFYSGLQVVFAARVRQRRGLQDRAAAAAEGGVEGPIVGLAVLLSVCLLFLSRPLVSDVLRLESAEAVVWLMLLGLALPGYLVNRMFGFLAVADDRPRQATKMVACIAAVLTAVIVPGLYFLDLTGAAIATVASELSVAAVVVGIRLRRRYGRR